MVNTRGFNPENGEWNDSLRGDYLWSSTNIGETLSDVLTPFSWSVIGASFELMNVLPGHPVVGNIGGRAYYNTSAMLATMKAMGKKVDDLNTEMGGVREEYIDNLSELMPSLPNTSFLSILRRGLRIFHQQKKGLRGIPTFLANNRSWCDQMRKEIPQIQTKQSLADFFSEVAWPYTLPTFWMVIGSAWEYGELVGKLRTSLKEVVSLKDADVLLSNVSQEADLLASLGPLVGLARVVRGEMDRQTYAELWGHRGPHESELSCPRPGEDPDWMNQQLSLLEESPVDVEELLARQKAEFQATWKRFEQNYPRKSIKVRTQLSKTAQAARDREAVRSELVRLIWVARDWALRAGELTGLGDAVFLLTVDEVIDLLQGRESRVSTLPARQKTYWRYRSLPPYPLVIRGQFDPFQWADDPQRRGDFFDAYGTMDRLGENYRRDNIIVGVPGSAGEIEGRVRKLENMEGWQQFQQGEILVTVQTNVGWAPIFPRSSAVVTDVGAPLSHAAIIARELGIPAVVNCGDATMRLHTGDYVRVDGSSGTVEILRTGNHGS